MCATPMLNWQSKHAGAITSASLNFAIAASWLLARLAVTPSSKIFFSSAALAASLAAVVGASTMVISDALPSTTLVSLLALPIFGSVAVMRYAPDCGQQLDELTLLVGLGRQLLAGAAECFDRDRDALKRLLLRVDHLAPDHR